MEILNVVNAFGLVRHEGGISCAKVAQRLDLTTRGLQRRLQSLGTTYTEVRTLWRLITVFECLLQTPGRVYWTKLAPECGLGDSDIISELITKMCGVPARNLSNPVKRDETILKVLGRDMDFSPACKAFWNQHCWFWLRLYFMSDSPIQTRRATHERKVRTILTLEEFRVRANELADAFTLSHERCGLIGTRMSSGEKDLPAFPLFTQQTIADWYARTLNRSVTWVVDVSTYFGVVSEGTFAYWADTYPQLWGNEKGLSLSNAYGYGEGPVSLATISKHYRRMADNCLAVVGTCLEREAFYVPGESLVYDAIRQARIDYVKATVAKSPLEK